MGAAKKLNHKKVLRDLVPINALSEAHIEEVARKAAIEVVRSGRYVFRKGDRDYQSVYLLEGSIELIGDGREVVSTVEAGSEDALHALAHQQPRQLSARASGKVTVARIDSRLLDVLLTWDESAGYDVVELGANDDDDWLTRMLQSQAFLQLPPSNIHQLLMRLESVKANAGDAVIRQGDDGDYFYIVKHGRLAVTRKASARGKEVLLAELGEGACFGEEALVSETKRNASVTMISDGLLMRLSKDDFNELLRAPLVHEADFSKAQELVSNGSQWLDVRLPGEFENQAIKGGRNLPLSALRDQCADLDRNTTYIVCCDTGRRSSAGAFVLSQRGFNVYALKNGLMDVPNEVLTSKYTDEPASNEAKDAEIIPFDADGKSPAETPKGKAKAAELAPSQSFDPALSDKLAQAEKEKIALQQQLERAEQQSAETKTALKAAESHYKEQESEAQQRSQQVDAQLRSAEQEKSRLQADLEQMAKRLDQQKQAHEQQSRELEQQLSQLRDEHQGLDQHASALAGEREAAVRDLEQAGRDLTALQERLAARQDEAAAQQESLKQRLAQGEQELEKEKGQRQSLEQQVSELDGSRKALEQQLQALTERADVGESRSGELETQLAAGQQKLQESEQSLQEAAAREQSLQARLEEAEQKSAEALEQSRSEASIQQTELNKTIAALQAQLDDQVSQQQSGREELEQKLAETQQSLEEAGERERAIKQQLQQVEDSAGQIQQSLDQSIDDADELRKQLDDAKQQGAESEKQVSELGSRLTSIDKEHASDIASLREALTRAQDERENVSREQTRLMNTLRKAEHDLESQRQDHESEVHRLQKELKEAAGESSSGLAAELDALQEQLKQGARQRDDLEIQLGERSAQMENAQAEAEKLAQQLKQAQESAHQAEQQLIEANQAANEEMTVRLDAEQQAQQALREQLEAVSSERNQHQEQLTVLNHELEELRGAVQQAQVEATENQRSAQALLEAEQQVQTLAEAAQQLEQARNEALDLHQQAQQEIDQLRAEAEVNRGLMNMQAPAEGREEALHAELVESKKSVDVAVRLRIQAEEKVTGLQQDVERLQAELNQVAAVESVDEVETATPALAEDDSQLSAPLEADFDHQSDDESTAQVSDGPWQKEQASPSSLEVATDATEKSSGSKILLVVLLIVGLAAAGAYWWFSQTSLPEFSPKAPGLEDRPADVEKAEQPVTKLKTRPSFAKGGSDVPIPAFASETASEAQQEATETPIAEAQQDAEAPEAAVDEADQADEAAAPAQAQPARTFRQALKDGGNAPTIVEFSPAGFEMGSSSASPNFAERPRHRVNLKRFAISQHEVTFEQYDRFAKANARARPNSAGWGRGTRPVINVSWQDAVAYTRWLSEQTGSRYRLPTEAEWEFAARSGSDKRFWWGNKVGEANANCFDCGSEWSGSKTAPVGSFVASAFELHDMAGNVMEWVQDCYRAGYAEAPEDGSAVEISGCKERVVRGGGFDSPADLLRSTSRDQRAPKTRLDNLGFRVVREF